MSRWKLLAEQRKAANLCLRCGGYRDDGCLTCTKCRKRDQSGTKKKESELRANGYCRCGNKADGGKMCAECKIVSKQQVAERRKRLKESGLCPGCGKSSVNSGYCEKCNNKTTKNSLIRYYNRKASGVCAFCGNELALDSSYRCEECKYAHANRSRAKWLRERKIVIDHYGKKCVCCGEATIEFLEIDHINNDGAEYRRHYKSRHLSTWIIQNNFPIDLQILCSNCNRCKGKFGACLHQIEIGCPNSKRAQRARRRRLEVIEHYGGKCICCGESNWAFLEFDHINNDGNLHRKEMTRGLTARWLIQNNYPDYIQLLCSNCNMAKGLYGSCPHRLLL